MFPRTEADGKKENNTPPTCCYYWITNYDRVGEGTAAAGEYFIECNRLSSAQISLGLKLIIFTVSLPRGLAAVHEKAPVKESTKRSESLYIYWMEWSRWRGRRSMPNRQISHIILTVIISAAELHRRALGRVKDDVGDRNFIDDIHDAQSAQLA